MPPTHPAYFDSCTHPTLNGEWTGGRRGMAFSDLAALKREIPGYNALAIGLPGVGGYEHGPFKQQCDTWGFEGIAAITTVELRELESEFDAIVALGFRGIKVHPRLLGKNANLDYLSRIFSLCRQFNLVCLLCTYEADIPGRLPSVDPFYQLCNALNEVPETRLILMHGGGCRLMQFASLARHSDSILLDLSFTLTDKMTNSLQPQIRDLVERLDQRICIGTDSPEVSVTQVFAKLEEVALDLDSNRLSNILSNNLHRFFPGRIQR
jgi:predicted TIM-barrel fold metal-dependent hydrolase